MGCCNSTNTVTWIQRLVHKILNLENLAECLLNIVVVVVKGIQKALSSWVAKLLCNSYLFKSLQVSTYDCPQALLNSLSNEKFVAKRFVALRVKQFESLISFFNFFRCRSILLINLVVLISITFKICICFELLWDPKRQEFLHNPDFVEHVTLLQV